MNLDKYICKEYSIRLKDFYKYRSLMFEINCGLSWWYFEPKNMNEFDEKHFEMTAYGSGYIITLEECKFYKEIVEDIKMFYPLNDYVIRIGL